MDPSFNDFEDEDTFIEVKVDKLIEKLAEIKKNEEISKEIIQITKCPIK